MAHFIGYVKGARGEASRLGHAKTGLVTRACSWQGAVRVELYTNDLGFDCARVSLTKHRGSGTERLLYDGPVAGAGAIKSREVA